MPDLAALVDAADPDPLLIAVDGLAASRDWDAMVDLAHRCREAVELGRQLWSVAMHVDYRLAWEAPGPYAAAVLLPGADRFTLGPLAEVAASTHTYGELAPHVGLDFVRTQLAAERALRGEDLRAEVGDAEVPGVVQPWEPGYALPRYRDRSAAFPQPEVATRTVGPHEPLPSAPRLPGDEGADALEEVARTWAVSSEGTSAAVVVEGDARTAVGTLAGRAGLLPVASDEALSLLQWAGASGGAYGRRPGGARGRDAAWFAAAALTGLPWPPDPAELGAAVEELRWYRWTPPARESGWVLRVAVEDPVDGLAWAVEALDARRDREDDGDLPGA